MNQTEAAFDVQTALTELVESLHWKVVNYLQKRTQDFHLAEDLAQSTYIRVLLRAPRLKEINASLLFAMAHHVFVDHLRYSTRMGRDAPVVGFEALFSLGCTEHGYERVETMEVAREVMARLSDTERKTVALFAGGLKYAEIAERLNIPIGTVKSRLNCAKRAQGQTRVQRVRSRRSA